MKHKPFATDFAEPFALRECPFLELDSGNTRHRFRLDHEGDTAALDPPGTLR